MEEGGSRCEEASTIRDVAREAGVSVAVVSRVLNDGTGPVAPQTRAKRGRGHRTARLPARAAARELQQRVDHHDRAGAGRSREPVLRPAGRPGRVGGAVARHPRRAAHQPGGPTPRGRVARDARRAVGRLGHRHADGRQPGQVAPADRPRRERRVRRPRDRRAARGRRRRHQQRPVRRGGDTAPARPGPRADRASSPGRCRPPPAATASPGSGGPWRPRPWRSTSV